MNITAADTAVRNLHLDIGRSEGLGRVAVPDHVALGGRRVLAQPALELVDRRLRHGDFLENKIQLT